MANVVYNIFLREHARGTYGWNAGTTVRALLVSNSSTYTPNRNHTKMEDLFDNGLVEIQDAGYSRGTLSNKTVNLNTTTNTAIYTADPISFGAISSGKTIVAVVFFIRVGAMDNPSLDIPIAFIDTATGLPKNTTGGMIILQPTDNGYFSLQQSTS